MYVFVEKNRGFLDCFHGIKVRDYSDVWMIKITINTKMKLIRMNASFSRTYNTNAMFVPKSEVICLCTSTLQTNIWYDTKTSMFS